MIPAVLLMGVITVEMHADDEAEPCPCFSYAEVESIFVREGQRFEQVGASYCTVEDYSVELKAEVTVRNSDYELIAQARVAWFDFDPGSCAYIDTIGNPGVERKVRWPHPAPEATARACFDIVSRVVAELDTSGGCNRYP